MSGEWWDLRDSDGELTGETTRRCAAHWPAGRYHLVVAVCAISADGRILLTQRAAEKTNPFKWEFPAGSAIAGETSRSAACRELLEETGLRTRPDSLRHVVQLTETRSFLDVYVAGPFDDMTLSCEPAEILTGQWLTTEEARRQFEEAGGINLWRYRMDEYWDSSLSSMESVLEH